ncbi:F-box protein-like [Iris pallida]|uniref:F-box protein-like n=1 Tax=Iris pallida TaxID=29817 RepID=A0AAX6I1P2_IRIPA|nr:F-box protein-like [Iris pallida]KAJ6846989.1 F-box protein-like [Iris pallida]
MALGKLQRVESFKSTRITGRKRSVAVNGMEESNISSQCSTPSPKRQDRKTPTEPTSLLDSLPLDLLVRVVCKATHEDLKQLLLVSKFVNEATSIAKEMHFTYSTPLSKRVSDKFGEPDDSGEAPNAPQQHRVAKSRIKGKLGNIAIVLFTSED